MTGSSRLIVVYAGSWALVAAGARSERPGLLRSFHQGSREDRSWLLTPYRPSETRRGSAGPNSKSESGPGLGSLHLRQEPRSMAHRRSSFVGHAASPEITRGCGVLHFLTMSYEAPFARSDGRSTWQAVRRGPTYSPAAPSPTTFSRGRPPVTNPFDLPSRLREGNGLLLSGTMNGAGRWLEEVVRVCADRSTAPPAALDHYNWRQHCRGLSQIPIAA
jgi:hypothetical protein